MEATTTPETASAAPSKSKARPVYRASIDGIGIDCWHQRRDDGGDYYSYSLIKKSWNKEKKEEQTFSLRLFERDWATLQTLIASCEQSLQEYQSHLDEE